MAKKIHNNKLQICQAKTLKTTKAPWHVRNKIRFHGKEQEHPSTLKLINYIFPTSIPGKDTGVMPLYLIYHRF